MIHLEEELLEESHDALRRTVDPAEGERTMQSLFEGLRRMREELSNDEWSAAVSRIREHPLRATVHQDPMARRSFEKPRGYAGDAVLLDYIYLQRDLSEVSSTGRTVNRYATGRPSACAVRHRKDWLAYLIDRTADRAGAGGARVLSVACGHLREGELSSALQSGVLGEFVALDADAESLAVVESRGYPNVRVVHEGIGRLLARPDRWGKFDLIYSAGLYDYLEKPLALRLTRTLFEQLAPGGQLVFTNFLNGVADAGYMETFMGWELILRDLVDISDLAADVPADELANRRTFEDPFGAIGTCVLTRRGG